MAKRKPIDLEEWMNLEEALYPWNGLWPEMTRTQVMASVDQVRSRKMWSSPRPMRFIRRSEFERLKHALQQTRECHGKNALISTTAC